MVPLFHHTAIVVAAATATAIFFFSSVYSTELNCTRSCGPNSVPYPFGFTSGCPILLNCSGNSSIEIGGFAVRNFTHDSLLLDVPPLCNRSITAAEKFFSHNYALASSNELSLRGCNAVNRSPCIVDSSLFSNGSCAGHSGGNLTSCFLGNPDDVFFNPNISLNATGCSFLFTSMGYDAGSGTSRLQSLDLNTANLTWWLDGECQCSVNADCTSLSFPLTKKTGFRCRCKDGFEGDGFVKGTGCHKAKCNVSKYISGKCGGTNRVGVFIAGIAAGSLGMAALVLLCYLIRRRTSKKRNRKSMRRLLSEASCTVPLYAYKDIERATNGFSDSQLLGTGAYGTVYSGKLGEDKLVAIKRIKNHDDDGIEQVMNEIKLVSSVSHPNLVRLLGCCIERGEQILVYEFMPNGTLAQHLQRERGPALPWTVRLKVATETAKAIAYLHSAVHPPIFHRDIKSSNILLDYGYNTKVADFGLSRTGMVESSHISTAPQGTPGYLDPQYHQNYHLSDKSDVYSFGVVLVEIITALKAVDFNRSQSEVNLAALAINKIGNGRVDEIVDPAIDPHRDAWTLTSIHKVAELAFRCLAFHRDMRPSMSEVADELEQIRLSGWALSSEDNLFMSTKSSLCSSPSNCTDKSRGTSKSRRLVVINGGIDEVEVDSPVSVQDPWFSEQSSPSSTSLLGNVAH